MTRNQLWHDVHFARFIHHLALETPVTTPDGFGGSLTTWTLAADLWGELRAEFGNESFDEDRLSARITHTVVIRYRDGLSPDMRFRLGNRSFAIRSILERGGRRRFLECRCEEIVT